VPAHVHTAYRSLNHLATPEEQLDQARRVLSEAVHLLSQVSVDDIGWTVRRGHIGTAAMNLHAVSRVSAASGI
jgi:hypothetical protein